MNKTTASTTYKHVQDLIPIDIPNNSFISIDRRSPLKVYSLGFQPAKTIPEIPHWFLEKYTAKGSILLEPFAGSGTSIIAALKTQRKIIWLDYHPLSQLTCRVKTSRFGLAEVVEELSQITKDLDLAQVPNSTVEFSNKDFWFQKPVQDGLEIIKQRILNSQEKYQPFWLLAFAATVRKCSDMNDGMILAARRPNIKEVPQRSRADVFRYFKHYAEKVLEALSEWYQFDWDSSWSRESESKDARNLTGEWQCDAIFTSPPYVNAIDYVWAAKFELHWLGFVQNDKDRLNLYSQEIGTERIPSSEYKKLEKIGHARLDKLIEDIFYGKNYQASKGQNELRAKVVYKYFLDMRLHFASCYTKLKDGGHYCFSVGDISKICGVDIPVAESLIDFAEEIGFKEVFRFHLLLKNRRLNIPRNVNWAGTIKHDAVVVLKK